MSVEGLWIVRFGTADDPEIVPGYSNAGVVVLETGRIFGGDFGHFYLGDFRVDRDMISGRARITHFNGPQLNAFGVNASTFEVCFRGVVGGPKIDGVMWLVDNEDSTIPIILEFKANLP
jgi:hypothetical protein